MLDGIRGHSILARPDGGLYVTSNGDKPNEPGSVWFIKDGKKTQVDTGLKFATGMAYRPDQWLLSVADGHSKWVYSYQINADGTLTNKERFFQLHVADWDDDAGRGVRLLLARRPAVHRHAQRRPDQRRRRPDAGHPARARPQPRHRRLPRRQGQGHALRLLRKQDLETQSAAPRDGRLHAVDEGQRDETLTTQPRCAVNLMTYRRVPTVTGMGM